jgi:hypothetical protein
MTAQARLAHCVQGRIRLQIPSAKGNARRLAELGVRFNGSTASSMSMCMHRPDRS